ncbi:Isonitrile hydratase [Aquicella siphonis]|uniref:Isonitrile hydratase n=1 Tax=Aquicella siphonis TaxID=254247 RepID=A0A5E4PG64_9COXI|nr:DJ-1/PfpI family protein [Aquicella siphonis]VVC75625.1 Isonitrile hydratase [Aquicella siphonis]
MNRRLGVLLYEQAQPMDIIGPWEVFSIWKNVLHAPLEMILVSENGTPVACDNAVILNAHTDFDHCPDLDYLVIPGGKGRLQQGNNARLLAFIKKQSGCARHILSVCTGAFLLCQAGVAENEFMTTYWRALPELRAAYPIHIKEQRVVKSGKIFASGGISSGIDLALEVIADIAGRETAGQVQLLFEYSPEATLYATLDTASTLPPYYNHLAPADLPEYIAKYIKSNSG